MHRFMDIADTTFEEACRLKAGLEGVKRMDYINAFWVGGLICALVQILMEKTKMMPGRIMVLLVVLVQIFQTLGMKMSVKLDRRQR